MAFAPIPDHVQQAKDRLIEQYKGKSRIGGLIEAAVTGKQVLEDVTVQLNTERAVETAVGAQLDGIGEIVGAVRAAGQSDADFRIVVRARIVQNLSKGTPEEVIEAAKFILSTEVVWFAEVYPAAVDIFTETDLDPDVADQIREQLEGFLPAGVSLDIFGVLPPADVLRFGVLPGFGVGRFSKVFSTAESFTLLTEAEEIILTEDDEELRTG